MADRHVRASCNGVRRRDVGAREPPVRLTQHGLDLFGDVNGRVPFDAKCRRCRGRGLDVPHALGAVIGELRTLAEAAPHARVELDQCHCTVETKVRRVLAMYEAGALGGRRVLVLGDDDLMAVALRLVVERPRPPPAPRGPLVVDVGPGLLAFGARRPDDALAVQRAIVGMGFVVRRLLPNFNDYVGAGVRGGTSHLYQLRTTREVRPLLGGRYEGPLYTGDAPAAYVSSR